MPFDGFFTTLGLAQAVFALVMWVGAFPTRGWISGTTVLGIITQDLEVGLFKTSKSGVIVDTKEYFKSQYDSIEATIITLSLGGMFLLTAIGLLCWYFYTPAARKLGLAYVMCAMMAGVFLMAGVVIFETSFDDVNYIVGYSWYLALFSGLLSWSSFVTFITGVKRGERDPHGTPVRGGNQRKGDRTPLLP
ncbi:unnamed protein product [Lymnaea stagnalis]|uniref:Uncharacterized protein n=1 Tax=Lymnaea stagnalis TaxID=6523 RepID=A0AAV2IFW3_LYMST